MNENIIAVVGAHGSGKSTIINKLKNDQLTGKIGFVGEVARLCPYPLGAVSDIRGQTWILRMQILIEEKASCNSHPIVLDRCVLDHYAYYKYWVGNNISIEEIIYRKALNYRKIFFLPENPAFLVGDGLRPVDKDFQKTMSSEILYNCRTFLESNIFEKSENTVEAYKILSSYLIGKTTFDKYKNYPFTFDKSFQFGLDILPPIDEKIFYDIWERVFSIKEI